jgi:hypothetical protein
MTVPTTQNHQATEYVTEFGDGPTPEAVKVLQLPQPVPDNELLDVTAPTLDIDLEALSTSDETAVFLRTTSERVACTVLSDVGVANDQNLGRWRNCYSGLYRARRGLWLEDQQIYHLADRLLMWMQGQPEARLGGRSSGRWWLVPEIYVLHVDDDTRRLGHINLPPSVELRHEIIGDTNMQQPHVDQFDTARFTVHILHCNASHWSIIIYQQSTGNSWYLDSELDDRLPCRSNEARNALWD